MESFIRPTFMLQLLPPPVDWVGPSQLICGLSGYPYQKSIEAAGIGYQNLLKRLRGEEQKEEEKSEVDDISEEEKAKYEKHKHKKLEHIVGDDPYEIMGLTELRWRATEEDIKTAFRKMVLQYHPDKIAHRQKTEADDELFKKISKANDILSDPKKRRALDSNDDFDDRIPSGNEKGDFFAVFGPVFHRFSRWSTTQPAPLLGDDKTPYSEVKNFYEFWFSFKSWRDFSFEDEYDLEEAESRDERRWMDVQNERKRRKFKKEEISKIFKLTETAEKLDPRVKKVRDQEADEKKRKKDEKVAVQRKIKEEADRKVREQKEEEMRKIALQEQQEKQKREEEKELNQARKKFRKAIRKLDNDPVTFEDMDLLSSKLKLLQIIQLTESLNTNQKEGLELLNNQLQDIKSGKDKTQQPKTSVSTPTATTETETYKAWTEEELGLLTKGLARFPGGAANRWEQISHFIGTRTPKEIIAKTKEGKTVTKPTEYKDNDAFNRFNQTKKKADKPITSSLSTRDDAVTPVAPEQSPVPAKTTTSPAVKPEENWTPEEQKALEKALQTFSSALTDRWDKVAVAVGRSKKDCILRYKYIVAKIKEQKEVKK